MLKIIKYKNHGICMLGGEEDKNHEKFLFSFFELSNKKVVSLMIVEYWNKDKLINDEYNSFFTNHQLDQPWDKWWESTFKDNLKLTDSVLSLVALAISCEKVQLNGPTGVHTLAPIPTDDLNLFVSSKDES